MLASPSKVTRPLIRPMLIVCPSCATSYDVEPASLPPQGRQVRCVRCRTVWHAEPSHADKLLAAAAALAPDYGVPAGAAAQISKRAISPPPATPEAASEDVSNQAAGKSAEDEQAAHRGVPQDTADEADPAASVAGNRSGGGDEVEAPPIVPVDLGEDRPAIDDDIDASIGHHAEPPDDIESVAARRHPRGSRRSPRWLLSPLQTCILVLILVDAFVVGWRNDIVRALPQTASFYALLRLPVNLRGLSFDGIVTTTEQHEGVPILVVEGNIVNEAHKIVDVPRLKFVVRNAARQEIYSWTAVPSRAMLPPGEAVAFRTRLAAPPPDAHDLIVRFVTRRDIIAATR